MTEQWRPVEGYAGYEVSDLGRVRCWRPRTRFSAAPATPRIVKTHLNRGGYPKATLGLYGGTHMVHSLVAEAFHGPRPDGHEVAHHNGVRSDSRAENLRWATRKENHADKRLHGTNGRRLTEADVSEIRRLYRQGDMTQAAVGNEFGVTQATVSKIVRNAIWKEAA